MKALDGLERDWPDPAEIVGEEAVEFTLQYEGLLPATSQSNTRKQEKQRIREAISFQLWHLWSHMPLYDVSQFEIGELRGGRVVPKGGEFSMMHYIVDLGEHSFLPLITRHNSLVCHLDIKLLRDGEPGELVRHGGDLDNRIKTLFDALRGCPSSC